MKYADLVMQLVENALKAGADEADVYLNVGRDFEVTIRNSSIEVLKQAVSKGIGIRVFRDHRMGFSHTTDFSPDSFDQLVVQTVEMTKYATQDEFHGLPNSHANVSEKGIEELDLFDGTVEGISTADKIDMAKRMEAAALAFDKRVKLVEGASVSDGDDAVMIANSKGFTGSYRGSGSALVCSVVAEEDGKKQVNYWYSNKRHMGDHETPEAVGRKASERTVQMLNARKIASGKFPVVLDPVIVASFLGSIAGALNGEAVFRKTSFLTDKLGQQIGSSNLTIIDDGRMKRGLGSRPFDGEGVTTKRKIIVENGVLQSYLYDSYTARKAKRTTTGNAVRGYTSTPHISPMNFYIPNGESTPDEIIGSVSEGLYITGMIGFGVDMVTGQFSRGASGMWIKNGKLEFPVHEVTVASNLLQMLQSVEMIGNDLEFRGTVASPTLKLREITISGI